MLSQSEGSLFQLSGQRQYLLDSLAIAYPPRELSILVCLFEKASDHLFWFMARSISIRR
jgi:hypothetical protein